MGKELEKSYDMNAFFHPQKTMDVFTYACLNYN